MNIEFYLACLVTIFCSNLNAQTTEHADKHNHHKIEIGIANAPIYFIKEKAFAYGLHLHFVRNIPKSKFGVGLGYERIFDKHGHNTFGLVAACRLIDRFGLNVSPGLTFEDGNSKMNFALHFETSYEFEISNFHVGPVFEFAYDPVDIHISIGLHVGYGF